MFHNKDSINSPNPLDFAEPEVVKKEPEEPGKTKILLCSLHPGTADPRGPFKDCHHNH